MGQRYGVLAQVYGIGDNYEYVAPLWLDEDVINGDSASSALDRATYLEQISEYRKVEASQVNTNIQLYSRLYNKLHEDTCKKLIDDPLWAEIERNQDQKGLMMAETKIMLLASSGNIHEDTHPDDPSCLAPTRKRKPPGLLHQDSKITYNPSISGTQAEPRNLPRDGFHLQKQIPPTYDHKHRLVGGIGDQEISSGTQSR